MTTDHIRAEAISRQRARFLPMLGVLLLVAQNGLLSHWDWRAVTIVQNLAWLVMAVSALLILLTGGKWLMPPAIHALVDDEVSRENRRTAITRAFAAAITTAMLVFVVAPFEPIDAQRAAHMIVSIGLAVGLLAFGLEERKSLG
ncbi:hypothetical protein [uncultured Sphingomonas sp.]|uniref:hypothetical protein n=1 Tax=uncultured Sphingomonas sp. TaxID=158754 RepID=UPI0025DEBB92|nr:hypothetical protein [uncultured Sphingomonas sp.]